MPVAGGCGGSRFLRTDWHESVRHHRVWFVGRLRFFSVVIGVLNRTLTANLSLKTDGAIAVASLYLPVGQDWVRKTMETTDVGWKVPDPETLIRPKFAYEENGLGFIQPKDPGGSLVALHRLHQVRRNAGDAGPFLCSS
jgi:hypothetical protein